MPWGNMGRTSRATWNEEVLVSTCVTTYKRIKQSSYWKQMTSVRVSGAQHLKNAKEAI